VLVGAGTALVALAAFIALTVALEPVPEEDVIGSREHDRRQRIRTTKSVFAAVIGFAGAALLITSAWPWSAVAVGGTAALYYATIVISTFNANRGVARWIRFERESDPDREGRPGRILLSTAAVMNLAPWEDADAGPVWFGAPGNPGGLRVAEHVQQVAEERARLWWVMRHPYGTEWWSRRLIRTWLIIRVRYLIGRPI
jgi:hypothetical protein